MVQSLRDELALLREKDAEHGIECKCLMAMIEDKDISLLTKQMARLLGKVDALTKGSLRLVTSIHQPELT